MTQTRDEENEAAAHGHFDVRVHGRLWLEVCPELSQVTLVDRDLDAEVTVDTDLIDAVITAFTSVQELLKEST